MSTYDEVELVCGLCGHSFEENALLSMSVWGGRNLDGRYLGVPTYFLELSIHECPSCGYVATDIEADGTQHKKFVKTDAYQTCEGHLFKDPLTEMYYKCALLEARGQLKQDAYLSFLTAAWVCDDVGDRTGAIVCRKKAIQFFKDLDLNSAPEAVLTQIDLLRRVGDFNAARELACSTKLEDVSARRIISFQKLLCKKHDRGCYAEAHAFSLWKRIMLWMK